MWFKTAPESTKKDGSLWKINIGDHLFTMQEKPTSQQLSVIPVVSKIRTAYNSEPGSLGWQLILEKVGLNCSAKHFTTAAFSLHRCHHCAEPWHAAYPSAFHMAPQTKTENMFANTDYVHQLPRASSRSPRSSQEK